MKASSTGSEDIYLGHASDLRSSVAVFQVEVPAAWSGTLTLLRQASGAPSKMGTTYTRMQDGAILSGSIAVTGSFLAESTASDLYLRHVWTSGAVDVYYTILADG